MPLGHRRILHVDMDAFYASVEQRDNPDLRGKPVIVAGSERSRGVVCAASYEARKFGVRSAMATSRALRLCPQVVRVPPHFSRYQEVSKQINQIFARYTEMVEPLSLDESFLDVTERCASNGCTATATASEIKQLIKLETGLTASAGVGPNKLIAKIASDLRKPDGLVVVPPERVLAFLHPLPVERVWGVGPVTAARLHEMGLKTIGDVAARTVEWLTQRLGRSGPWYHDLAHGIDDRPVIASHESKSVSAENTFAVDLQDVDEVLAELAAQAEEVADRLARHGYRGRTVTLKARYGDFTTVTRSLTVARPLHGAEEILEIARQLLLTRTLFPKRALRLVGVGVSHLMDEQTPLQLELWTEGPAPADVAHEVPAPL